MLQEFAAEYDVCPWGILWIWGGREQLKLKIQRLVVDRETDVEEKDKEDLARKGEKIERRGLQRRMRKMGGD